MITIETVCTSETKGVSKTPVDQIELVVDHGVKGDAHAGNWHRQVSFLQYEKIDNFNKKGAEVKDGDFGENIIIKGLETFRVGQQLQIGDALIEITQLGKECHTRCSIYYKMGECIMPKNGVFGVVLQPGIVKSGDEVVIVKPGIEKTGDGVIVL